jgi:hypothetical protein
MTLRENLLGLSYLARFAALPPLALTLRARRDNRRTSVAMSESHPPADLARAT